MRIYLLFVGVTLCSACASTPYIAGDGIQAGYWEREFLPGKWHVGYRAQGHATADAAANLARRRASEICGGHFTEIPLNEALALGTGPDIESCGVGRHSPCRDTVSQIWVQCGAP